MTATRSSVLLRPRTLAEALDALTTEPLPTVIAGGTDIMPAIRSGRRAAPERWLAVDDVEELTGIGVDSDAGLLRLGAATTHAALGTDASVRRYARSLGEAGGRLGSPATRAWGTLGGTIAQASRSMDAATPLLVLDARLEIASARRGRRRLPFEAFSSALQRRDLASDELIVAISVPTASVASAFVKLAVRGAMDVATVSASAALFSDGGGDVDRVRLAVSGLWSTARRLPALENRILDAGPGDARDLVRTEIGEATGLETDGRVGDDYRRAVAATAVRRAFQLAWDRRRTDGAA